MNLLPLLAAIAAALLTGLAASGFTALAMLLGLVVGVALCVLEARSH